MSTLNELGRFCPLAFSARGPVVGDRLALFPFSGARLGVGESDTSAQAEANFYEDAEDAITAQYRAGRFPHAF